MQNNTQIHEIKLTDIDPDPNQPREIFDKVDELAASMAELGLLQAILVLFIAATNRYRIIAGESRFRAAQKLRWDTIPCFVLADERKALEAQMDENLIRTELDPFERAKAFRRLKDAGWTSKKIGRRFGYARTRVESTVGLERIPTSLREEMWCRNSDTAEGALFRIAALPEEKMKTAWKIYVETGNLTTIPRAKDVRGAAATNPKKSKATGAAAQPARRFSVTGGVVEVIPSQGAQQVDLVRMLEEALEKAKGRFNGPEPALPADLQRPA